MKESHCKTCGRKVDPSWGSCPYCGKPLEISLVSKVMGFFGNGSRPVLSEATPSAAVVPVDSGEFRFEVEDVFSITGRGLVVTGTVQGGSVSIGNRLIFASTQGGQKQCSVKAIEAFRKVLDHAEPGQNVGLLLSDLQKNDIAKGIVLSRAPGRD